MARNLGDGGALHAASSQRAASVAMRAGPPLSAPQAPGTRQLSLSAALRAVWVELRGMVREHAVLVVLEAQRAGLNLAYLLAGVIVVAVLVVSAWLASITALVVWLVDNDVPWSGVLALAAVLNLIGAAFVAAWVKRQVHEPPFSATLRQLSADRHEVSSSGDDAQATRP
jgi:uncharacterized membrane protein YqjE